MSGVVGQTGTGAYRGEANRLGLDYSAEAGLLGEPPVPIIDIHTHINGPRAAAIWARAADLYGVDRVYSMSRLSDAAGVRDTLGDRISFIAFPDWANPDREAVHRGAYLDAMRRWGEEFGARVVKFWSGPALVDYAGGDPADLVELDSPWRRKQADLAVELGMMFMVHIADPDTWFSTRYTDSRRYRTKAGQYPGFERMVGEYQRPWIAAHMGGWPEDLGFLDGILTRHDNLYLDCSATKWVVRELSAHPRDRVAEFVERWRGRLLFGSDIVTMDAHLSAEVGGPGSIKSEQASSEEEAFDLYASRYWALRVMLETSHEGESPIVDPDLAMVDPARYDDRSAPPLRGLALPRETLAELYRHTAESVVERWCAEHP